MLATAVGASRRNGWTVGLLAEAAYRRAPSAPVAGRTTAGATRDRPRKHSLLLGLESRSRRNKNFGPSGRRHLVHGPSRCLRHFSPWLHAPGGSRCRHALALGPQTVAISKSDGSLP